MSSSKPKFKSKLNALIARGPHPTKRAWQDSILTYLTQNCSVSNSLLKKEQKFFFPSPLPVNVVPKNSLLNELRVHEHGDTPLTLAVRCKCTTDVIAALCHLYPDGAKVTDKRGALPLHVAAKRPSNEGSSSKKKKSTESEIMKIISILIEANPTALIARDYQGKTPLHVLLENHAETRTLGVVELFGRIVEEKVWKFEVEAKAQQEKEKVPMPIPSIIRKKLPKEVNSKVNLYTPASAVAIPDNVFGAIPLHYAVKNGLSKEIVAFLIKSYPASVCQIDCNHHTPLHWVFGVQERNQNSNNKTPPHHIYRSSSVIAMLLQRDPSQTYNVATMKDRNENGDLHRTPLHYAVELLAKNIIDPIPSNGSNEGASASCITLKSLQALVEADSKALVTKDSLGHTPLHVLFRTVFEKNDLEYKKALIIIKSGAQVGDSPQRPKMFSPPKVLVELLICGTPQESINPASISDLRGLLPLHCAVLAVTSPSILGLLIHHNPKALTHLTGTKTNEFISKYYDLVLPNEPFYVSSFGGSRTPLHLVYASPYFINSYSDAMVQKLLLYDSAVSSKSEQENRIKIDASIALKMQDSNGDTPLHLAARNQASIERLHSLLQRDVYASITPNKNGDLPLHLLMDRHFLFVNAELVSTHSNNRDAANPLGTQHSPEFREKVRELAKKQTVATRMAKFQLCGAIFAPTNGWTNDDEASNQKDHLDMMQKINLLGMTLINDVTSLKAPSSQHGLLPLHILVAFHAAPYRVLSYLISKAPETLFYQTNPDGYTALDLHLFRKKIPGEIKKHEVEAWKAIRQLLFINGLFPLETMSSIESGPLLACRTDKETLTDCEQQIVAEVNGQGEASYHLKGNHPVEANHLLFGFLDGFHDDENIVDEGDGLLSDICLKIWIMMTCYVNLKDAKDNYADSVANVLGQLDFQVIDTLTNMKIPSFAFANVYDSSKHEDYPAYTVYNYCNVYCKERMYSFKNFAGMYSFTPPSNGASILIHRERCSQSVLVHAIQKKFIVNYPHEDKTNESQPTSWLFTPMSDVRDRSDFSYSEVPICIKFMKNKINFETEVNWRKELSHLNTSNLIVPIIDSFGVGDEESNKRYMKDRQDERFSKMPLRANSDKADMKEWLNLSHYPYAIIFPFSADGNLTNVLNHGLVDSASLKDIAMDMGYVLKDLHGKGLIHSTFSVRNILSFPKQKDGIWKREWKLSGINSVLPSGQTSVHLGAIDPSGRCSFESEVLPPEMFKKLDSLELAFYNNYWKAVCDLPNVNISREFYTPRVDPDTGYVYVVKCYCNLDESLKRSLPPLPYDLLQPSAATDLWSFGVFLFTLLTGGNNLFHSNSRTSNMSSLESAVKWTNDTANDVIQQFVTDPIAQDVLLYLLSTYEERAKIDLNTVLCHPYFISDEALLPKEVKVALAKAKEERMEANKARLRSNESELRAKEIKNDIQSLSRMGVRNHLLLVNSTTEVIKEAFGSSGSSYIDVPYSFIILPYKLARNKAGKLTPTSMTDVELSERLGKQLLELSKATCFASCLKEFYSNATKDTLELIHFWSNSLEKYPIQTAEEILRTFHLDPDKFLDLASKFVAIVRADNQSFLSNPINSAMKLVKKYATPVTQIFAVNGKAYFYPVDEYTGMPIVESSKGRRYPHTFRDCVTDIVYKFLPYMQTCITRMMSESGNVESLVKLIFEGASPNTPSSWVHAAKGLPKVFLKRRMVAEALILHEAVKGFIPANSPVSLNGKEELEFIHSLYTHIDSTRTFGGLKPVTDGKAIMWTQQEGIDALLEDCKKESDPDHLFSLYKKDVDNVDIMMEKDAKIAKLEKTVESLSKTLASIDGPEMEI